MCVNVFTPMIYDDKNGWVSISNNKMYEEREGDELTWLNEELVYIRDDIFNISGKLIKTLDLEGNIVGVKPFLDKSKIAVFASKIDEPLNLYIFDSNCNEVIQTIKMPFTYKYGNDCNSVHLINLKSFWIDNESLLVEGCGQEEIVKQLYTRKSSLYKVNIKDKTVEMIKKILS